MPFLTINNKPLYYEISGTGKPLLLIHAMLLNSQMWADQVAEFSKVYQVITLDLYGFGKSKLTDEKIVDHVADIKGLLDALGIEKVYLLGLSMGSMEVMKFAIQYPQRVEKLMVISTGAAGFDYPDNAEDWWQSFITAVKANDFAQAKTIFEQAFVNGSHYPASDALKARTRAMMDEYDFRHFLDDTLLWKEYSIDLEGYQKVTCPVLVMAGDNEPPHYMVVEASQHLVKHLPNAQLAVIPNAGHFINLQQPEAFNQSLDGFLKG